MKLDEVNLLEDTWEKGVPHEMFELLRREAPVFHHPEPDGPGFWAVTKHADIVAISRDTATFSSELGGTFIEDQTDQFLAQMRLSILNMDPPKHNRYRRLVSKGFTPRVVGELTAAIERRADRIVDDVIGRGECDFVEDLAALLPLEVICEMIGLAHEDWPHMFELSNRLIGFDDPEYQTSPEVGEAAAIEIFTYCDKVAAERRASPQDDLMTALVQAELDGERLDVLELNLFFITLVVAGNETTRNLINHSMLAILEHPDQAARLKTDPSLWPTAVEEMLRWGTSIHNFRRTVTTDAEIHGQPVAAGDKVVMYYMSANRDDEVFVDPFRFDVSRTPNDHLTFGGGGVHYCLGASLARAEIGALMRRVVERLDNIELAGDVIRLRSDFVNGVKHMPIKFTGTR
jgi:cholest-4-en-3-one 26-monooxygenase